MTDDVVARAKAALEVHECADCDESPCSWGRYDQGERCLTVVPELIAEVERLQQLVDRVREMATSYTPSPDLVESIAEELGVVRAAEEDES